jgi:hypothetical protein
MLFPNCFLLGAGQTGFLICIGLCCLAVLVVGAYMFKGSRGLPRLMIKCAITCSVCEIAHVIALGAEGRPGIAAMIFLVAMHVIGGCVSVFILLWSFVSPTLALMMMHDRQRTMWFRIKLLTVLFVIEQVAVFIPALVFQYQGNFALFNQIFAWQLVFIGAFYALIWMVAVRYYSTILFEKMDSVLAPLDNPKVSLIYRHRLRLGL